MKLIVRSHGEEGSAGIIFVVCLLCIFFGLLFYIFITCVSLLPPNGNGGGTNTNNIVYQTIPTMPPLILPTNGVTNDWTVPWYLAIERSTNMQDWITICTNPTRNADGTVYVSDPDAPWPKAFYRARVVIP